jgi:hypothetical protein
MVMPKVRLALAQTNPIVGDIGANTDEAFATVEAAAKNGAEMVQRRCCLCPRDLLLQFV